MSASITRFGYLLARALAALAVLATAGWSPLADAAPTVRIGYVVPDNRSPQPQAEENLAALVASIQQWYGRQMQRYGFGYKTFEVETLEDGVTPRVHTVWTTSTDATLRSNLWGETIGAASDAGLSVWSPGEVWFLVSEAHLQNPDGSVVGGTALGASFGSGDDAGVAMLGGDSLFRSDPAMLSDTRAYHGVTVPEIGPYPLVDDVSFPWFENETFSSIASSIQGAAAHELGHALGLGHDYRNDSNFDGILMGHGLRGWRGAQLPGVFPNDSAQLGYAAALALDSSRYFNSDTGDEIRPTLAVATSGQVGTVDGLLEIDFQASDSSGLSAVLLRRNGDTVGELALEGSTVSTSIATPYFEAGAEDNYTLSVYDRFGNRTDQSVTIQVSTGANRAIQPFVDLSRDTTEYYQPVLLDASRSFDPDGSLAGATVEWDLDGDGVFDTPPSTNLTYQAAFATPGDLLISARLTDSVGAQSVSTPVSLVVEAMPGDFNGDGAVDAADYTVWRDGLGGEHQPSDYGLWTANFGRRVSTFEQAIPEPGALLLLAAAACGAVGRGGRQGLA